jgi:hypothetical protein
LAALAALTQVVAGCAGVPAPPTPEVRANLRRIALVAVPTTPEGQFHTFAKGRLVGTSKGAAGGALEGMIYSLSGGFGNSGGGPYAPAATMIAGLVFAAVGAGIGAATGHQAAIPGGTAADIEDRINTTLRSMELSKGVAEAIHSRVGEDPEFASRAFALAEYARSYERLADQGIDTVLEISIPEAGFQGGEGKKPSIAFYMTTRVRFTAARDGRDLYTRDFLYVSHERLFSEWFDDGAKQLALEFERATQSLAERILDEVFLVTAFPFPSGLWALPGDPAFSTCWFRPIDPDLGLRPVWEFMVHPGSLDVHRDLLLYPLVGSRQPTLEWEPLPRPRDQTPENRDVIARISDVRYDLKIWEADRGYPERLVYDRVGLVESRHRLAYALKPGTKYFWTFRARYKLDGEPQATRWAFSLAPVNPPMPPAGSCDLDLIPNPNYFRFATP